MGSMVVTVRVFDNVTGLSVATEDKGRNGIIRNTIAPRAKARRKSIFNPRSEKERRIENICLSGEDALA